MPFEIMDQRSGTGSHFFEDVHFSTERQFGFWKSQTMADHQVGRDGLSSITGRKLPVEKLSPNGMLPVSREELAQSTLARDGKAKIPIGEGNPNISNSKINFVDHDPKSRSSFSVLPASHSLGRRNGYGIQWESSLFSSSFSDIFSKKLQLSGNDIKTREPEKTVTSFQDEEPFESLEEIEAQTIGNLLPAEDDLFSGVTSDLGGKAHGNNLDDLEDFDLFSSSGGMELEGDDCLNGGRRNTDFFGGTPGDQGSANGSVVGEHPSRTLFVRNINSNVEDSELKSLFEQYGDIQTLYTACKHRGFVMISYYDTRAARNAMSALQNKPLRRRKLDIHYSIPKDNPSDKDANQGALLISNLDPSVTKDELHKIFSAYGEIKEIRDAQHKSHQKCIEYYDIRAAEAALSALNRSCIAGKQIELEHSHSGGSRWLMEQPDQELEESHHFNNFDDYLSRQMAISPGIISSGCMDNGSTHVRHSVAQSPSGTFIENHWSSSVHSNITSPVPVVSISKQYGLNEHHINMDNIKFNNQCLPSFHPHSLRDYHDGLVNGIPYTSSSIGSMACNIGSGVTEAVNNRRVSVGSNGHPMEFKGGVFGSAGNGTGPLPGHHYMWNNSNIGHQQSSSRMIWSNSQSFVNGIHAHHLPQMTGFPRAPSVMMNAAPALHHVGSAPAVNPSIWERRHAFSGESPDASSFYLGSTASVGFSGSSPSHPLEVASRNILSPSVGNFVDMTRKAGMRSPQQMSLMFPGRSTIISMPSSFDSPSERMRSMSQRRTDSNGNQFDKKLYELDLERILRGDDNRTTLMIKNIPNKYTSKMLLAAIDEYCRGTYDFIYLPIDFKNKCNVGYAFINMVEPQQIIPFHKAFNGKKWEKFNSEKVASLAYARIQGKAALVAHFQNSSLMNEDKRCRPILFHTDGPNAGDPEPFPMGTNIRSRPGKHRASNNDDNHLNGNHSILVNGEDSSNGTDSSSSSD